MEYIFNYPKASYKKKYTHLTCLLVRFLRCVNSYIALLFAFALLVMPLIFIAPNEARSFNPSDHQVKPINTQLKGKITFLDGTPVYRVNESLRAHLLEYPPGFHKQIEVPQESGKPFVMKNAPATAFAKPMATDKAGGKVWVDNGPLKDGIFHLTIPYPGKYVLRFNDVNVIEFTASINDKDGLIIDLPRIVKLPFNYLIKTKPGQNLVAMEMKSGGKRTISANDNGNIYIKDSSIYTAYAISEDNLLPTIDSFNAGHQKSGKRTLHIKPIVVTNRYKNIHNIKSDMYYWLRGVRPVKKGRVYYYMTSYSVKSKKSRIKPVSFSGDKSRRTSKTLYLDEKGNLMVAAKYREKGKKDDSYDIYSISKSLSASSTIDPYYPAFRFKGKTFSGGKWLIPNLFGIPFREGGNSMSATCSVKADSEGAASASSDFSVIFDEVKKRYKLESHNVFPSIRATSIIKCDLAVGGYTLNYSYRDIPENYGRGCMQEESTRTETRTIKTQGKAIKDNAGKVIGHEPGQTRTIEMPVEFKMVTDEDCVKAMQKNIKNLPMRAGFEGEGNGISLSIDLRDPKRKGLYLGNLINMKEGPYPALKYKGSIKTRFDTEKAAKEKCKRPRSRRAGRMTVYSCEEDITVNICPDKYRISFSGKGKTVNYDAMYSCKSDDPAEGVEINLKAEAKGFEAASTSWNTKDYEPSNITVIGTVNNEVGIPIQGATVTLPGLGEKAVTDIDGKYKLSVKTEGAKPFTGRWDFVLTGVVGEISVEITLDLD